MPNNRKPHVGGRGHLRPHMFTTDGIEYFYCARCETYKLPDEFNLDKKMSDGRQATCRACEKMWRIEHDEELKIYQKERNKEYKKTIGYRIANFIRNDKKRQTYVWWNQEQEQIMYYYFGHKCVWCGSEGKLEIDHFIPVKLGGKTIPGNMCPICRTCNMRKLDKDPYVFAASIGQSETLNWIIEMLDNHYRYYAENYT